MLMRDQNAVVNAEAPIDALGEKAKETVTALEEKK